MGYRGEEDVEEWRSWLNGAAYECLDAGNRQWVTVMGRMLRDGGRG